MTVKRQEVEKKDEKTDGIMTDGRINYIEKDGTHTTKQPNNQTTEQQNSRTAELNDRTNQHVSPTRKTNKP